MPNRSRKPCAYPGCSTLVDAGYCTQHKMHAHEQAYRNPERNALYDRKWQARRRVFLAEHPWCEDCLELLIYTPATDVHHVEPHRGDPVKFVTSPLRALCHACHSKHTLLEVQGRGGKKVLVGGASSDRGQPHEKNSHSEDFR